MALNKSQYYELIITILIPVSIATCERRFSKLKIITNYLRSAIAQEWLSGLEIIPIESDKTRDFSSDAVVEQFAVIKARRQHFTDCIGQCSLLVDPLPTLRLACSSPHQGEPGSTPGFSHVGIVPDNAAGRRVFSGISRFPRPFIPALPHNHLNHPHQLSRHCLPAIVKRSKTENIELGSPLVDDRPIMNAVKYRVVSGVVWTNRTMVSSNTATNRTDGDILTGPAADESHLAPHESLGTHGLVSYALTRTHNFTPTNDPHCPAAGLRLTPAAHSSRGHAGYRACALQPALSWQRPPPTLLTSYLGEPGFIPGWVEPGFSHMKIVPDNVADRRIFSGKPEFLSRDRSVDTGRGRGEFRVQPPSPPQHSLRPQKCQLYREQPIPAKKNEARVIFPSTYFLRRSAKTSATRDCPLVSSFAASGEQESDQWAAGLVIRVIKLKCARLPRRRRRALCISKLPRDQEKAQPTSAWKVSQAERLGPPRPPLGRTLQDTTKQRTKDMINRNINGQGKQTGNESGR
ncbi:hypothetical protein PR048_033611 [Dryococelus australis]|uniref:HAT C-terminal dimerisation domain-containing protein n=1 Tax=Dryococelus australis TaxID=614101 RepID=A0ABQ9G203_9NEOP|nr:hypothetical protein PR048_033611 [Dryococelus australis]